LVVKPPRDRPKRLGFPETLFYTDGTVMCSDHCAVDHISGGISLHHFSQRFEHRVEHAPSSPIAGNVGTRCSIYHSHQAGGAIATLFGAIHIMPSKYSRLPCAGRHPRPVSGGRSAPMIAHSSSKSPIRSPTMPPKGSVESITDVTVNLCPRSLVFL
jgi:hypothetical protein